MPLDGVYNTQTRSFEFELVPQSSDSAKTASTRSRTSSVSNVPFTQKSMSVRKRPSLPSLALSFLPRRSISEVVSHSRTPSSAGTSCTTTPIFENDNSDLLDDDPFAADTSRFVPGHTPNSASFSTHASVPSTPSLISSSLTSSSTRSSRDSDIMDDEACVDSDEEGIKVEPFHRLPPPTSPHSLRRTRSRPSLAGRPSLPCLSELEMRPLSQFEIPVPKCVVVKAKAKAGKLPVEPWDNLPDSGVVVTTSPSTPTSEQSESPVAEPRTTTHIPVPRTQVAEDYRVSGTEYYNKKRESAYAELAVALGVANDSTVSTDLFSTTINTMALGDHTQSHQSTGKYSGCLNNSNGYQSSRAAIHNDNGRQLNYQRNDREDEDERRRKRDEKWGTGFNLKSAWSDDEDEDDRCDNGHASTPSTSSSSSSGSISPQKLHSSWTRQEDDEDDIPLAKQIPTALTAQKSIRANLREEKHRKRIEKLASLRAKHQQTEAAKGSLNDEAMKAEILANKLLEVQNRVHGSDLPTSEDRSRLRTRRSMNSLASPTPEMSYSPLARSSTTVTPRLPKSNSGRSRSQTRASPRPANLDAFQESNPPPMPNTFRVSERNTVAGTSMMTPSLSVRRANTIGSGRRTRSTEEKVPPPPPVPPLPIALMEKNLPVEPVSNRTFHPMRIYISDSNFYVNVEVEETTTAGEVVEMIRSRAEFREALSLGEEVVGEWMLWELAKEFNMERPIRSFERPLDVTASWNAEKRVNTLVMKKTTFAPILKRNAIPGVAPQFGGYVEWESRKGKWNKRWLGLRESSLFLSKKEHAPDEVFLCSLSNFDAYIISSNYRSPKKFAFAIRSTDNATLFENPADYMHVFSCDPKSGRDWLEKLLVGRSFVLQQERTILFRGQSANNSHDTSSGSGIRRQVPATPLVGFTGPSGLPTPPAAGSRSAPSNKMNFTTMPFEKGSLLAKQFSSSTHRPQTS